MIGDFLKKLFGSETESEPLTDQDSKAPVKAPSGEASQPDPESFVTYIVRSLVDDPEQVSISSLDKDSTTTIQVSCAKKDIGKVIGRSGKTIGAIRALANGAGGRVGRKINVEVMD